MYFFRISLYKVIFFHVALFSCCTVFILRYFHVVLFCVIIFSCGTFFVLHSFICCTISCCTFTRCSVFVLYFLVALFACCNFFLLHYFHDAIFPEVQTGSSQITKMASFITIIYKTVTRHCCKALNLRCSWGPGYAFTISMLPFFHVVFFSCCTLFMPHFFNNEKY